MRQRNKIWGSSEGETLPSKVESCRVQVRVQLGRRGYNTVIPSELTEYTRRNVSKAQGHRGKVWAELT
jgi:hypothetical protein